ncbi:MAG TPA: PilN domain-containing protein [Candidatus Acidoferrales bacterium]|nr:PilN domain-containing protein [Candidatus Acidoferrales bacterium]
MIRINLLGQERPKTSRGPTIPLESSLRLVLFVASLLVAFVVLFAMYHQKQTELAGIESRITSEQAELVRLQQVKTEVEKYEQQKTVLQQRINVIEELQANRSGGQQLLQMVAVTVEHSNEIWLTSMTRKGDSLDLGGEAVSINAIANFVTQMKRSGYFGNIEMKQAAENDLVKGAQTFQFTMSAQISSPAKPTNVSGSSEAAAPARPGKS